MGFATGGFTAASQVSATTEGAEADLIVGGTFVATVQLQASIPSGAGADTWISLGQLTAPGVVKVSMATGRKVRAQCSAFTSGTALYSLGASHNVNLKVTP